MLGSLATHEVRRYCRSVIFPQVKLYLKKFNSYSGYAEVKIRLEPNISALLSSLDHWLKMIHF